MKNYLRTKSIYNDSGNIKRRTDSSRLRDKHDQVIGLQDYKAVTGRIEKVFIVNNKMKGIFLNPDTNKKERVTHLSDSVWLLDSLSKTG